MQAPQVDNSLMAPPSPIPVNTTRNDPWTIRVMKMPEALRKGLKVTVMVSALRQDGGSKDVIGGINGKDFKIARETPATVRLEVLGVLEGCRFTSMVKKRDPETGAIRGVPVDYCEYPYRTLDDDNKMLVHQVLKEYETKGFDEAMKLKKRLLKAEKEESN